MPHGLCPLPRLSGVLLSLLWLRPREQTAARGGAGQKIAMILVMQCPSVLMWTVRPGLTVPLQLPFLLRAGRVRACWMSARHHSLQCHFCPCWTLAETRRIVCLSQKGRTVLMNALRAMVFHFSGHQKKMCVGRCLLRWRVSQGILIGKSLGMSTIRKLLCQLPSLHLRATVLQGGGVGMPPNLPILPLQTATASSARQHHPHGPHPRPRPPQMRVCILQCPQALGGRLPHHHPCFHQMWVLESQEGVLGPGVPDGQWMPIQMTVLGR